MFWEVFLFIVGVIIVFVGQSFLDEDGPEYLLRQGGHLLTGVGIVAMVVTAYLVALPKYNHPRDPIRLSTADTLYVAPMEGIQGVALIVTKSANGPCIQTKGFVAQHVIQPVVK